tara:strand:+ start:689 stop:1027 length:339 start_codon:yes stop_codon:yes gene_type:complete
MSKYFLLLERAKALVTNKQSLVALLADDVLWRNEFFASYSYKKTLETVRFLTESTCHVLKSKEGTEAERADIASNIMDDAEIVAKACHDIVERVRQCKQRAQEAGPKQQFAI